MRRPGSEACSSAVTVPVSLTVTLADIEGYNLA
jgi:hypothetical protein